jgi:uncharacterized protein
MCRRIFSVILAISVICSVCPAKAASDETHAQAELSKESLVIVGQDGERHKFNVEMALTPDQQEIGLMLRSHVANDGGMLFYWERPHIIAMWMKNTLAPLDMVFITHDGRINRIVENAVPQSLDIIDSGGPISAALELAAGTTHRLHIEVGDKVEQRLLGTTP